MTPCVISYGLFYCSLFYWAYFALTYNSISRIFNPTKSEFLSFHLDVYFRSINFCHIQNPKEAGKRTPEVTDAVLRLPEGLQLARCLRCGLGLKRRFGFHGWGNGFIGPDKGRKDTTAVCHRRDGRS